tara:strand:- start:234 stop:776 length:543 start_codon:yes stop_codon:yes gene_type:complete
MALTQVIGDGLATSGLPTGSVLQVVNTTKTDTFTGTNSSFTLVTGLAASITPSSTSNKILVLVSVSGNRNRSNSELGQFTIFRTGVGSAANLINAASVGSRNSGFTGGVQMGDTNGAANMEVYSTTIQDSPSSTAELTYEVRFRNAGSSEVTFVNRSETDTDGASGTRGVSTITLMEIAG